MKSKTWAVWLTLTVGALGLQRFVASVDGASQETYGRRRVMPAPA